MWAEIRGGPKAISILSWSFRILELDSWLQQYRFAR